MVLVDDPAVAVRAYTPLAVGLTDPPSMAIASEVQVILSAAVVEEEENITLYSVSFTVSPTVAGIAGEAKRIFLASAAEADT